MTASAIPALEPVFGVAATHVAADGGEAAVTVMPQTELAAVGEYGERMEERMTLELAKSHGAAVGDVFTVDGTDWQTTQLLADDGYLQRFAVLDVTA